MSAKIFRLKIPKEEHALISLPIAFHFFYTIREETIHISSSAAVYFIVTIITCISIQQSSLSRNTIQQLCGCHIITYFVKLKKTPIPPSI